MDHSFVGKEQDSLDMSGEELMIYVRLQPTATMRSCGYSVLSKRYNGPFKKLSRCNVSTDSLQSQVKDGSHELIFCVYVPLN